MNQPISVTVLADTTEADQSLILNRLLAAPSDLRIAAVVPRHLRKQIRSQKGLLVVSTNQRLARLGQICDCCPIQSENISKIRRIASNKRTDHIVIQVNAEENLEALATSFTSTDKKSAALSKIARIESIAVVIDACHLLSNLKTKAARPVVEQVEFANVIILKNAHMLAAELSSLVIRTLFVINPSINIINVDAGDELTLCSLRSDHPFDLQMTQ